MFLHFDRERRNSLGNGDFGAALASLGLNYDSEEMEEVFFEVSDGKGSVNFEQFIRFMVHSHACQADDRWSCMKITLPWIKYELLFATSQMERLPWY